MDGVLIVVVFTNFTADSKPLSQLKLPIQHSSVWPSNTRCCFILCPPLLEGFQQGAGTPDDSSLEARPKPAL